MRSMFSNLSYLEASVAMTVPAAFRAAPGSIKYATELAPEETGVAGVIFSNSRFLSASKLEPCCGDWQTFHPSRRGAVTMACGRQARYRSAQRNSVGAESNRSVAQAWLSITSSAKMFRLPQ